MQFRNAMMLVYRFQLLEPMLFYITDAKDQHKQMSRCTHTETVGKKLSLSFGSSSTCSAEKTPSVIHPLMSILSSSYKNREKRKGGGNKFCAPKRSGVSGQHDDHKSPGDKARAVPSRPR